MSKKIVLNKIYRFVENTCSMYFTKHIIDNTFNLADFPLRLIGISTWKCLKLRIK